MVFRFADITPFLLSYKYDIIILLFIRLSKYI